MTRREGGGRYVKALRAIDRACLKLPPVVSFFIGVVVVFLLVLLDRTGVNGILAASLVPVSFAAWYGGRVVGWLTSFLAAISAALSRNLMPHLTPGDWMVAETLGFRFAAYLLVSEILCRLRDASNQQKELTEFVVHDLRSPISSAISGLLTLQETATKMDWTDAEVLSLALVSNQRALSLVNSLLDLSRLERGRVTAKFVEVELESMVCECLAQLELWARNQNVQVSIEVHVVKAQLDPDLTSRVLINLVSNALKFSPEGSVIIVEAAMLANGSLRFRVRDQGPGIPPEYVKRVFDRFVQVKGTRGGSGLGLAFCRQAINAQGGRIWAESKLGKGTTMVFTIPKVTE